MRWSRACARCLNRRWRPRRASSGGGCAAAPALDALLPEAFALVREAARARAGHAPLRRAAGGCRPVALALVMPAVCGPFMHARHS